MSGETPSASGAVGSCAQCSEYEARISQVTEELAQLRDRMNENEARLVSMAMEMEEMEDRMNENDTEKEIRISQVTEELAQLRVSAIPESDYKGKSVSAVFRIPRPRNNDFIKYVYRSLKCSDNNLRKEEIKFQKEQLQKIRGGFPDAQLIAFMYRGNWQLTQREVMKQFSVNRSWESVTGENGKKMMIYPLKSGITDPDREIMSAFWNVMTCSRMADYTDDKKRVYDCCSRRNAEGEPLTVKDDTVFIDTQSRI